MSAFNGDFADAASVSRRRRRRQTGHVDEQPLLLTVGEAARVLRTTNAAVYAMVARGQMPGVTRLGRRVLFRTQDLLDWLDQKRAPSPER